MTTVSAAPVRVSLYGPGGRLDTGVWDATTPASLVTDPRVRPYLGLDVDEPAVVVRRSGALLDGDVPLIDQGVEDGDMLLAVATARVPRQPPERRTRRTSGPRSSRRERSARSRGAAVCALVTLVGAGVLASTTGAGVLASTTGGVVRTAASALLLLGAVVAATVVPADPWGDLCRLTAPVAAGAGAWTALAGPGPGEMHLALAAGAVSAAVATALARNGTDGRAVADALLVTLVVTSGLALALGVGLLAGMPLRSVGPLAAAAGVLGVRLIPSLVVDVPDEALLELDRLSVTAWSAHEQRRRRGWRRLRTADVADLVGRGRRVHRVALLWAAALGALGALATAAARGTDIAFYGSPVLVGCVAVALPLMARTVRDDVGGTALRVGGGLVALAGLAVTAASVDPLGRAVTVGAVTLLGVVTVVSAVALGRGWRSVRWGRSADLLEGLAVTLVVPATLVASGGVDWVRQLAS
ncbi:MAG: hypothetical protein ACRDYU_05045 [Actinomycetes bacterium]